MPLGAFKASVLGAAGSGGGTHLAAIEKIATASTVSYTHLTLPTKA